MSERRYTEFDRDKIIKFISKKINYLPCIPQFTLAIFISCIGILAMGCIRVFVGTEFALQGTIFAGIIGIACFILSVSTWRYFIKHLKSVAIDRKLIRNGEIYVTDVVVVDKYTRVEHRRYAADDGERKSKIVTYYFIVVKDIADIYSIPYEVTHKEYAYIRGNDSAKVIRVGNQNYLML